jgi:hypothetical protein
MIRPSEIIRAAEDGFIGCAVLVRGVIHGLKRDVLIEYNVRQMVREHKREQRMTAEQRMEAAADMAIVLKRADELLRKE